MAQSGNPDKQPSSAQVTSKQVKFSMHMQYCKLIVMLLIAT